MIVLAMIVKNESHVIRRCLESVKPFIDAWIVSDTGSTDGTQDIVLEVLGDLPGRLLEREWVDFGTNRNQVLKRARGFSQSLGPGPHYALTIDADEVLRSIPATYPFEDESEADGYTLDVDYAGTRYRRLALVRLDRGWQWVGPVHEYLDLPGADIGHLTSPTVSVYHEGARSLDPTTYVKDAVLLEKALAEDPGNPRWQFYLAESYRFAGMRDKAVVAYKRRAANLDGFWEERFWSHLQIGSVYDLLTAYELCPWRAEPLIALARHYRSLNMFSTAVLFAERATRILLPSDGLFLDLAAYGWSAWDELAIASYWAGDRQTALYAADKALSLNPDDERLVENLRLCKENAT